MFDCPFMEGSAKNNLGIVAALEALAREIIRGGHKEEEAAKQEATPAPVR